MQTTAVGPITFEDKEGVKYTITINGYVYLRLPKEKKERKIGKYDKYEQVFIKNERVNPDAIYYKLNSFGFPYHLLQFLYERLGLKKVIVNISHWKRYEIEADKIFNKELAQIRNYKRKGYELRLYIPIKYFKKIERRQ